MDLWFHIAKQMRALRNKKKRDRFEKRLNEAKLRVAADATAYKEVHRD